MKNRIEIFENLQLMFSSSNIIPFARKDAHSFTRKRKLTVESLILYNLNKKGLTTKMELRDFIEETGFKDVSSPALLKQREKLNPEVFTYLNDACINDVYNKYKSEVETFKGFVLLGIDGSDWEVPNTPAARETFKASKNKCARIRVSNCFDLLNCFILDTQIESNKFDEKKLARRHSERIKELMGDFESIRIMDRGYACISEILHSEQNNQKFLIRMKSNILKAERAAMTSDDEIIEVKNVDSRNYPYKKNDPELYEFFKSGKKLNVRIINITLPTGEIETLMTNLTPSELSIQEADNLYQLRWGIETNYHYLKESMKVTNVSSSKETIVKQEIYSQMLVFNMLQCVMDGAENEIDQEKYKHKMKININMAVGFLKRRLIKICLEEDRDKRNKLYNELYHKILSEIVPVRPGRSNERIATGNPTKNKHHINKRKSF